MIKKIDSPKSAALNREIPEKKEPNGPDPVFHKRERFMDRPVIAGEKTFLETPGRTQPSAKKPSEKN
jgi:hypothetical protein